MPCWRVHHTIVSLKSIKRMWDFIVRLTAPSIVDSNILIYNKMSNGQKGKVESGLGGKLKRAKRQIGNWLNHRSAL